MKQTLSTPNGRSEDPLAFPLSGREPELFLTIEEAGRLIDLHTGIEKTARQYKHCAKLAIAAGVNWLGQTSLIAYTRTLTPSKHSQFNAVYNAIIEMKYDEAAVSGADIDQLYRMRTVIDILRKKIKPKRRLEGAAGRRGTWLTVDQVQALYDQCDFSSSAGRADYIALRMLFKTGMRREEAINSCFKDMHMIGGEYRLRITGKGSKTRYIPLSADLLQDLQDWKRYLEANQEDKILRKVSWGRLAELPYKEVYRLVKKYGAMIGVPTLSTHDSRRTFAQRLYEGSLMEGSGYGLVEIQHMLGHANIETTIKYLDLDKPKLPDLTDIV